MAIDNLPMDFGSDKPFYVYLYRDPRRSKKRQPIYVGKGTVKLGRADTHWEKGAKNPLLKAILDKVKKAGMSPEIEIIAWFDGERAALSCERALITKIGRRDLNEGPLANLTDGGEGPSRLVATPEYRARQGSKTRANWEKQEYREKVITASKMALSTPEQRAANGARFRDLWKDPEYRARQTENIRLIGARPEVKASKSAAMIRRWGDPEQRSVMLTGAAAYTQTEKYKAEKSASTTAKWADPAHREMRIEKCREAAAKPERRAALVKMLRDPEMQKRRAESMKANNRKRWKWEVDGVVYDSINDAAKSNGVGDSAIYWRIKNGRGRKIRQAFSDHEALCNK